MYSVICGNMARASGKAVLPGVIVRLMREDDAEALAELGDTENWNIPANDIMVQLRTCPQGSFTAEYNGEKVGFTMSHNWGDHVFGGMSIVKEDLRGKGIGSAIWRKRFEFVGDRNFGVDGVETRFEPNIRLGFVKKASWRVMPLFGHMKPSDIETRELDPGQTVEVFTEDMAEDLYKYDSTIHIVARRDDFLKLWFAKPNTSCYVARENGNIVGYGCIMPVIRGYRFAPLYAETPNLAYCLMKKLLETLPDPNPLMTIFGPDVNPGLMDVVKKCKMELAFEAMNRQFSKDSLDAIPVHKVFANMGAETTLI